MPPVSGYAIRLSLELLSRRRSDREKGFACRSHHPRSQSAWPESRYRSGVAREIAVQAGVSPGADGELRRGTGLSEGLPAALSRKHARERRTSAARRELPSPRCEGAAIRDGKAKAA